jgi:predicted site-specific integrase-resolvase
MMLERHYSLSEAARLIGVDRRALKRWLRQDLGIVIPRVRHGAKVMIRERDIERVLGMRRDARGGRQHR